MAVTSHTILASSAFLCALFVGSRFHYRKIVKNEIAGYPDEWWPSVSATIGDWYPERSLFQIMIAITAGPRFMLILCWWILTRPTMPTLSLFVTLCGLVRTLCCGGWVYITSSDDHGTHDFLMISYIVLNVPWMIGSILSTPAGNVVTRRKRKRLATLFFTAIVPLIYFFVQHKVERIPGAYTKYSFCEWFLILTDIWFDSFTATDFSTLEISISHASVRPMILDRPMTSSARVSQTFSDSKITEVSSAESTSSALLQNLLYVRFPVLQSWREVSSFAADVYLAYVWWSILTVLAPSLFYFSVWQLSISGQEISLVSTLSPIILASPSVLSTLNTHKGRTWMYLGCTIGLIAYITNYPWLRLLAVSVANVLGSLIKALEWSDAFKIEKHSFVLALGLIMASLSKLINHSVNPIWPIVDSKSGGWNKSGIFLALLAVWEYATRDLIENPEDKNKAVGNITSNLKTSFFNHWLLASTGLGGLLFSLHCFLTDSDTILANSWTGYPLTGPLPGIHGYLTLTVMAVGLFLPSSSLRNVVEHPIWMVYGALSSFFMYKWKDWPGYFAGLCLAMFLSSLIPTMLRSAAFYGLNAPAKVYFTAWLVICLLYLANVWTVAYAFVPAGWLLRERTDIVLFIQMMMIFLGLVPVWRQAASRLTRPEIMTSAAFIRNVRSSLALFVIGSILSTASRIPVKTPIPHHAAERMITAGIWTMHFGIDDEGRDSQHRIRDLIRDMELDIIGLLETDVHRIVFGNRDITRLVAGDLGYYVDIGPGPNSHTWGAALLSKFPILTSTHHLLPSPHGELAPAISAVLDVWGLNITVVVSHNGQEEDALDRELQSTELARIMAATYPEPVIFLGYVVTKPLAKRPNPYQILISDGMMYDIDDEDWDRWCEYILYRGVYRTGYARVSRSTVTDTELQIGKFVIPKPGHPIVNASRDDRYLRVFREVFPSTMWFPDEFQDQINPGGVRGHYYHVNPWPLYYRLPENALV